MRHLFGIAPDRAYSPFVWFTPGGSQERKPNKVMSGAQYCTGIGQLKVRHLRGC
jgi:hypothetical protein